MYLHLKRLFDILLSFVLLLLLSPVLIILLLILFVFNKNDVFYKQKRIGLNNDTFGIIKFATMLKDSENLPGGTITLRNDSRVTKIGKILRFTKLNELPQLINIFIGDMSFVGPRPMVKKGFDMYTKEVQSFIYQSRPGITGISSIIFRDEEKWVTESKLAPEDFYKRYIFPYKGQLEKWYHEKRSFGIDLIIILLTAFKIVFPSSKLEYKIFPSLPKSDYFKFNMLK